MSLPPRPNIAPSAPLVTVEPIAWKGGLPGRCYHNVSAIVSSLGGAAAYGWAIAEFGPVYADGRQINPLYCRWINYIVWQDVNARLWEVTPNFDVHARSRVVWLPTTFSPDPTAVFEVISEDECYGQPSWYVAVRPEGEQVADMLSRAQLAASAQGRNHWLQLALAALQTAGFQTKEWRVEIVGPRINNIWLIAK